jgi:hypothetical protein
MNYAVGILGHRNKSGSFESLLNQIKNFTMYTPKLLDTVQYWSEDEIYDRSLFELYIKERIPELAMIKSQDHKTSLNEDSPSFMRKALVLLEYAFRGHGVMNYNSWIYKSDFKSLLASRLKDYDYISRYIDVESLCEYVYTKQLHSTILTNALKMNEILYLVENIKTEYHGLYKN